MSSPTTPTDTAPLLSVRDLEVTFNTPTGPVHAVRGVDIDLQHGETLGVVGESGCGKSVTFRSLLGLTPASAVVKGSVSIETAKVHETSAPSGAADQLRRMTAMVYQNPGAALNPVFTIGKQLSLAASTSDHQTLCTLLDNVGLPDPEQSLRAYPHEFSGGMQQRAVIAFALAQKPTILIADEPTTALDVTTQLQILELLEQVQRERQLTMAFVSHDLGVIERIASRVAVMYAGRIVEVGPTVEILGSPEHPYTKALLKALPGSAEKRSLHNIAGRVPSGRDEIVGCAFAPRCEHARPDCATVDPNPVSVESGHDVSCVLAQPGGAAT